MAARIIGVVLALLVCCVFPIFVNDIIGYLPLIAFVILLIISFVYLQILRRSLSYSEASLVSLCEREDDIEFKLHFKNASFLVFPRIDIYIYVSDLFEQVDSITRVPLTLLPRQDRDCSFNAIFDHIGTYSAGIRKIVIYDLIGIFTHTIFNKNRHQVEVVPKLYEAEDYPLTSESTSETQYSRQALVVDDMDYAGVREYAWGDSMKMIHWKLSAKDPTGNYLTRLFETYNNPGLAVILDTSSPNYDSESKMSVYDAIAESAVSINQYAISQGIDSLVEFRNRDGDDISMRIHNENDFPDFTHELPRIKAGDGYEARELLTREMNSIHGQDNVAFCTSQVNEEIISTLVTLKMRKRNPL
ncbi:MAG: DUF58 domain-containing protein, partial [Eggerthellaceae bacterium]|nr:DUF58 domain-containing protein [Eggerthellaceae bacterium]